jgi:hypothetical protein
VTRSKKIPGCVPPSVVSMACAMRPFEREIPEEQKLIERLLTDRRMETVWRHLKGVEVQASTIEALPENQRMRNWVEPSLENFSLNDEACAAFFASVVIELGVPKEPATRRDIPALTPMLSAAEQCRFALSIPRVKYDHELAKSLLMAKAYFEDEARKITNHPYFLGRRMGEGDTTRARVRAIAARTRAIFGKFLYGTVATVASIALQTEIGAETVRKWCSGLAGGYPCQ